MANKKTKGLITLLVVLVLTATTACSQKDGDSQPAETPLATTAVELIRDVEYGRVDGRPLLLDIYRPLNPIISPMPAVIWIHGGGWRGGSKFPSPVEFLAKYGFLGISIEYRLSGEATFPAAVEDSKYAVRWLRAKAKEYNVDPDRIGVWGGSAGGHLSLMVATAGAGAGLEGDDGWGEYSSRVQAAVAYYGPSDFTSLYKGEGNNSALAEFIGGTVEERPQAYWLASPLNHITPDDPPLLLVHGDLDSVVPFSQSEIMYQAYRGLGLEVTLVKVSGAGHGFKPLTSNPVSPSSQEIEQLVLDFFLQHLVYANP